VNKASALVWHFGGVETDPQKAERDFISAELSARAPSTAGLCYAVDFIGYVNCLDAQTGERYWGL